MPDRLQQHNEPDERDERAPLTADDTLYDRLCAWARLRPTAPCLSEADSGARLTYGEYVAAIGQMQRALGTAPRRIALALPGGLANAVVWASALTSGHALLPLAPDAPPHEVWSQCQQFQPDTFIVERRADAPPQAPAEARILTHADCDALIRAGVADVTSMTSMAQPAADVWTPAPGTVCLFTSGSTGEPKRVELSATQITCAADQIRRSHQLTPADRGLTVLPFFHINAPVVSLCASLLAGAALSIAPRFSVSHFWEWVERERATWVSIVPTILALLLETEPPAFLPGALRFVRTASAPLAPAHLLRFEQRFGVPVIETYGLTEAASQVCANPLPPLRHKPGSVGLPVGVNLRICALRPPADTADAADTADVASLREVERGTVGEVCVTGPSVISAYAGRAGASAFQDGWFRTGDLGYKDADGYVYLTGRLRDVIIRGGENVAPREVEETLLAHASIAECAVIGAPDPLYGEQVVAFLTTRARWTRALEAQLQALCAERLSPHKRPAALVALRALPRTTSGKIDRPGLRQLWARQEALRAPVGQASAARAG